MYSVPLKDIHEYDNQITNIPMFPDYEHATILNLLQLLKNNIFTYADNNIKKFGISGIDLIISDFLKDTKGVYSNYDEINNIRADILIANISEKLMFIKLKYTKDSD